VAVFVTEGKRLGFIRPSRRLQPQVPDAPLERYVPLPPELELTRKPRYATGQGRLPIIPALQVDHRPPPRVPIAPERRNRGGGRPRKKCHDA
jgi:hypothetical protein